MDAGQLNHHDVSNPYQIRQTCKMSQAWQLGLRHDVDKIQTCQSDIISFMTSISLRFDGDADIFKRRAQCEEKLVIQNTPRGPLFKNPNVHLMGPGKVWAKRAGWVTIITFNVKKNIFCKTQRPISAEDYLLVSIRHWHY